MRLRLPTLLLACVLYSTLAHSQTDTIRLYKGGPNYVLSHSYTPKALPECSTQQTSDYYKYGAGLAIYHSGKNQIGDITPWNTLTGTEYLFKSFVPLLRGANGNNDTITTGTPISDALQLVQQNVSYTTYIKVTAASDPDNTKWLYIGCNPIEKSETVLKNYYVIVENKPAVINKEIKICPLASPIDLMSNVDKPGGTFTIVPKGQPMANAVSTSRTFNPKGFSIGTYTVYYRKPYANDPNSTLYASFDVAINGLTVALKAVPSDVEQGDFVKFEANITTTAGDQVSSLEWDYGDKTPTSKLANPAHYYLDSGAMQVVLKVTTKNGCAQTLTKPKAVYVRPVTIDVATEANGPTSQDFFDADENDLRFFPNPSASGTFHFKAYNPLRDVHIEVKRMDGIVVFEHSYKVVKHLDIDLGAQGAGLFVCTVKHGNDHTTKFKLIKQ